MSFINKVFICACHLLDSITYCKTECDQVDGTYFGVRCQGFSKVESVIRW